MSKDIPYHLQQQSETDQRGISGLKKRKRSFIPARDLDPSAKRVNHGDSYASLYDPRRLDRHTGLPKSLKAIFEHHSGFSLNDVRVYYNSNKPEEIKKGLLAYTKGNTIHLAPKLRGKLLTKYLAHELWHVIQQKQGRVKSTKKLGENKINVSVRLEEEANRMSELVLEFLEDPTRMPHTQDIPSRTERVLRNRKNETYFPKDVIQMRETRRYDDFDIPNSLSARALDTIMPHLSRRTLMNIAFYKRDPHTTLCFDNGPVDPGAIGQTRYFAEIAGIEYNLDQICNPYDPNHHLSLELRHDTPIRIVISIDPQRHNDVYHFMGTLIHEIDGHGTAPSHLLRRLRGGTYGGAQFREEWSRSDSIVDPHLMLVRGYNIDFNRTARQVFDHLIQSDLRANPPTQKGYLYQLAIRRGMDATYNDYCQHHPHFSLPNDTPRYPI